MNNVVRNIYKSYSEGIDDFSNKYNSETTRFLGFVDEIYRKDHLERKTKELISVAIAVYIRCDHSVVYHVYQSFEAGAKPEEIMEAGFIAVAFGGEAAMSYMMTLLKDCVEEFEKDFKNKK